MIKNQGFNMQPVDTFIRQLDQKVWHVVENIACRYPQASRLLAFPLAMGTFVRDTLAVPAKCLEEIVLIVKSFQAYRAEQNLNHMWVHKTDMQWHAVHTIKYLVLIPFSPLIGIVDAIISLFKLMRSPLKTAKINAAKQDFSLFLEEQKQYNEYEVDFAKWAWNRFKQQVQQAHDEDVKNLHFLDTETSKKQFISEIAFKWRKFQEAEEIYEQKLPELKKIPGDPAISRLKQTWQEFKTKLALSSHTEAKTIQFNPTP